MARRYRHTADGREMQRRITGITIDASITKRHVKELLDEHAEIRAMLASVGDGKHNRISMAQIMRAAYDRLAEIEEQLQTIAETLDGIIEDSQVAEEIRYLDSDTRRAAIRRQRQKRRRNSNE